MTTKFIPKKEFDRIKAANIPTFEKLQLIATMCRLNTLFEVKRAGSGHLGSSFSAMDIVVYLYHHYLNLTTVGTESNDRDIYFSSKGHDVPGQYAVLYSLGIVAEEKFLKLRRLGGLDGHPDVKIPGIEANTGSLGMGISKGRGISFAKKLLGRKGKVIVMTGDGELQEGQNFEALQSTVQQKVSNLIVVVDHNKLQSDRKIDRIVSLGDLERKFAAFGWAVARVDGHDYAGLEKVFKDFEAITDKPKICIFDTIKGKGVSFMEHPRALEENNGFYKWHAGAPDDVSYKAAYEELLGKVVAGYNQYKLGDVVLVEPEAIAKAASKVSSEFICDAYGAAIYDMASKNKDFIVLDADLSLDCRLRRFEDEYAPRFVECGIAEQDMVSMAAGIALQGLTPVVNTFANFLAARTNEQICNTLSEGRKIIFSCHYAGLIPAGPGKSHQSIRDISLFAAFPNCTILQPANAEETRQIVEYAIQESKESCMLRLNIGPSPQVISLPEGYKLKFGQGVALTTGSEYVMFAYGPVMLNEALVASQLLKEKGVSLKVINMPWLNRFDRAWLTKELATASHVFVSEDHAPRGGLGDRLLDVFLEEGWLTRLQVSKFGVEGFPACGTPAEALKFHGLDSSSLAERVLAQIEIPQKRVATR